MNTEQLEKDVKTFKAKIWQNQENKELLNLVLEKRLNLCPATVFKLDRDGWNHLEIISLSQVAGQLIHKLPTADIDFLNAMQEKFGYVFGANKKFSGKCLKARVDNFYSQQDKDGQWCCSSAIFTLDSLYGEPKIKKTRTKKAA